MNRLVAATLAGVGATVALAFLYFRSLRPVGDDLLKNGSFADLSGTFHAGSDLLMTLNNGATDIPGWEVINRIIWSGEDNSGFGPQQAPFFLDLANRDRLGRGPFGGIKQTILLEPESDYRFKFFVGTSTPEGFKGGQGKVTITVTVENGGATRRTKDFTYAPSGSDLQWEQFTLGFDTSGWLGSAAGIPAAISIHAGAVDDQEKPLNRGRSFIGIDNASLFQMLPIFRIPH